MEYPVIDMAATGSRLRSLIRESGRSVSEVAALLGLSNISTLYKWLRGDTLPAIDNMLALSMLLGVSINDFLAVK